MKKYVSVFSLLLTATILLFGCRKGGLTENQVESTVERKGASTEMLVPPDVYVVGSDNNQAIVWKNGVGTTLPEGREATGIVIVGTDVYICGWGIHPTTQMQRALYWKNGNLTILSDGSNIVRPMGIAVSGPDVYVSARVGIFGYESVYYKNGVSHTLGSPTTINKAQGVVTDANGNFYIPNALEGSPSYWLNGNTLVSLPATSSNSLVTAMAIHGTSVHVVGQDWISTTEKALYWKDGIKQNIGSPGHSAVKAVAVKPNGQAVFSGTYGQDLNNLHIAYWPVSFDPPVDLGSAQFSYLTTGIAVDQTTDDIYVCGSEDGIARYWKNGALLGTLGTGSATAVALGY